MPLDRLPPIRIVCSPRIGAKRSPKLSARTDITEMRNDLIAEIYTLRDALPLMTPEQREALAAVETFCAVALRIIAKTNPSKVRSEAMTTEISFLMDRLPPNGHTE